MTQKAEATEYTYPDDVDPTKTHRGLRVETKRSSEVSAEDDGKAKEDDEARARVATLNRERREKYPRLAQEVVEITNIVTLGEAPLADEDEQSQKVQGEAYRDTRDQIEGIVWEAMLAPQDEHVFTEIVEKMDYIYKHPVNAEAQLRGLYFEAISHRLAVGDPSILYTYGPETLDEDTPANREKTQRSLEEMRAVPIEEVKMNGGGSKLEKAVVIGEQIRADVSEVLQKESLRGKMTMVTTEQLLDDTSPLPENAVYVYLPKVDRDKNSRLANKCRARGIPFYCYSNKDGWHVELPSSLATKGGPDASKNENRRWYLFALEYFIRQRNERYNQSWTTPDGALLNDNGVPVGIVETKCWYSDEIDAAILAMRETSGLTPHQILGELEKSAREEREKTTEQRKPDTERQSELNGMNLSIKLAEELDFVRAAGMPVKEGRVLLRMAADMDPGQAEEIRAVLARQNFELYLQVLPVTADQVGRMASLVLESKAMVVLLKNRYDQKMKEGAREAAGKALKARCLAMGTNYEEILKQDKSPDQGDETLHELWADVRGFEGKKTIKK